MGPWLGVVRGSEGPSLPPIGRGHPVKSPGPESEEPGFRLSSDPKWPWALTKPFWALVFQSANWQQSALCLPGKLMFATSWIAGWEALCKQCWAVSLPRCQDGELLSPPSPPGLGSWPFLSLAGGGSHPLRETGHASGFARDLAGVSVPLSCRIQDNAFPFCGLLSQPPPQTKVRTATFVPDTALHAPGSCPHAYSSPRSSDNMGH